MKRFLDLKFSFFVVILIATSCQQYFRPQSVKYAGYAVEQVATDTVISNFLKPYSTKVGETMNDVVAELPVTLKKELPNNPLGNFMADSYLLMARKKFDASADVAFINNGGIRLNSIQSGPLKRGTIYEIMPFDNILVILKISGTQLKHYLDFIASEGGCGIAGVKMQIRDKKATDILINGKPLEASATYAMVNSDYAVGGGGGYTQFRDLPVQKTGYLLRDATLDYCALSRLQGKPIEISVEKRISNGN
jgi:2',3'-cyclic-nucleotide 2'-phosphodiesterase (5'-nucleotidase family)